MESPHAFGDLRVQGRTARCHRQVPNASAVHPADASDSKATPSLSKRNRHATKS